MKLIPVFQKLQVNSALKPDFISTDGLEALFLVTSFLIPDRIFN